MSVKVPPNTAAAQERRLKIKTLGQQMKRLAISGAGLSPWAADGLLATIEEVYLADPELRGLQPGQLKYACVAASAGPGKPLPECAMTTVVLTLLAAEDRQELPPDGKLASVCRRHRRLRRLTEEAREQGGLLTQEDLAEILGTDVRTIRRDIRHLRQAGIVVATRGQQQDIGPGVTHRGLAVRRWLEGQEPVAIAQAIHHSLGAVEHYLEKFKRVAYLRRKHFDDLEIALTVGLSVAAVKTFGALYQEFKGCAFFATRLAEINVVGQQHYLAADEKKDSASWRRAQRPGRRP